MRYGEQNLFIDNKLGEKLLLAVKRCTGRNKQDNIFIVDGDEGIGKTTLSATCAKFCAVHAKRKLDHTRMFFEPEDMMKMAAATEDQIFIWDEAAIGALSTEWWKKAQTRLVKFLMVSRKKRHIYFFNIPKIFRLNEYLAVDRSIGLIHVYAREHTKLGWFTYYTKDAKERLFEEYKRGKKRKYKAFSTMHGAFSNDFAKIIDEERYDVMKDTAIDNILKDDDDKRGKSRKWLEKLQELKYRITQLPYPRKEISEILGVDTTTISKWTEFGEKTPTLHSQWGLGVKKKPILKISSLKDDINETLQDKTMIEFQRPLSKKMTNPSLL